MVAVILEVVVRNSAVEGFLFPHYSKTCCRVNSGKVSISCLPLTVKLSSLILSKASDELLMTSFRKISLLEQNVLRMRLKS